MGSYNTSLTYTVPIETLVEKKAPDGNITSDRTSYTKFKYGLTGTENDFFVIYNYSTYKKFLKIIFFFIYIKQK